MSRRKPPETQASLFGATPAPVIKEVRHEVKKPAEGAVAAEVTPPAPGQLDAPDAPERPKLRLVHSVKEWDVTVEATEDPDAFYVTRYRDSGTSSSQMLFTRAQLERLVARAQAALKVT